MRAVTTRTFAAGVAMVAIILVGVVIVGGWGGDAAETLGVKLGVVALIALAAVVHYVLDRRTGS